MGRSLWLLLTTQCCVQSIGKTSLGRISAIKVLRSVNKISCLTCCEGTRGCLCKVFLLSTKCLLTMLPISEVPLWDTREIQPLVIHFLIWAVSSFSSFSLARVYILGLVFCGWMPDVFCILCSIVGGCVGWEDSRIFVCFFFHHCSLGGYSFLYLLALAYCSPA